MTDNTNKTTVDLHINNTIKLFDHNDMIIGNIRLPHSRAEEISNFLGSIGGYVCMKEYSTLEHFHFAIHNPSVNRDTIAKKIRTVFPELKKSSIGGAKQYHVAYAKQPQYQLMYIFKEWDKATNPFTLTNLPQLTTQLPTMFKYKFALRCHEAYHDYKTSFKKHTPGQFLEYLTKETNVVELHKNGIPDVDPDDSSLDSGQTILVQEDNLAFRKRLARHAIDYLKKIDIATCGPNKIWDLVNYANLHLDEVEYTNHILEHSYHH